MSSGTRLIADKALDAIRTLPRVAINNIKDNPGAFERDKFGRGQYGGHTHGCGDKGAKARQRFTQPGFEGGATPFYRKIPKEDYYKGLHMRKEYFPISLHRLQELIDLGQLNPNEPIDLTSICNTKQYFITPVERQFGFHLTDKGLDCFKAKVNIEVQWASEHVIAAVERNGGAIWTAYYDMQSLWALSDPVRFFRKGVPIPKRLLPTEDVVGYYLEAKNRGYLADPEKVAEHRLVLAQKFGYKLPNIKDDPKADMLMKRKDTRQIFFGLEPGWVVNMQDKTVLKPTDEVLKQYYSS